MTTSSSDEKLITQPQELSTPSPLQHHADITPVLNNYDEATLTPQAEKTTAVHPKTQVRQLFVGNLPFRMRWQDLKDLFRNAGQVLRADVALSFDNRSKGHGTVLFASVQDAQAAIDMLHNSKWHGRVLEVREDRGFIEQPLMKNSSSFTGRQDTLAKSETPSNQVIPPGRQLFVGNLPFHCQWQDVKDLFRRAGKILRADVAQETDGRSRGFGTVLFATFEDAKKAIEMLNGYEYQGRQLRVHFDKFATGMPCHTQQQLLPSKFGNIEFTSPDPDVLESLKQTYGTGIYATPSPYDDYNSQIGHSSDRHQPPFLYSNQRLYYPPSLGNHQDMINQQSASSFGTDDAASSSLFMYQNQSFATSWMPSLQEKHELQPALPSQPYLYSPYQQQIYPKGKLYDLQPQRYYQPNSDDLNDGLQRMSLSENMGQRDYGSRNSLGVNAGKNGNSSTNHDVWDPLNRLKL